MFQVFRYTKQYQLTERYTVRAKAITLLLVFDAETWLLLMLLCCVLANRSSHSTYDLTKGVQHLFHTSIRQ